jgi:hypothetical protein
MRFPVSTLLVAFSVSCSTIDSQLKREQPRPEWGSSAPTERAREVAVIPKGGTVSLPKLTLDGVNFEDGLQVKEAVLLSSEYFRLFVAGCGMPDDPKDGGRFWCVQLLGGYSGVDYGHLLLAKDGSEILLEPPKNGFKFETRKKLQWKHISLE